MTTNKKLSEKENKDLGNELELSSFFNEDDSKIKAIFNDDYQNRFIKCFIESDGYAEQIIDIIVPDFFENYQKILVQKLIKFYEVNAHVAEYESLKRDIIKTENDPKTQNLLTGLVDKISSMNIKDQRDVQETAQLFFKKQSLKNAIKKAAYMWKKNDYDSIAQIITDALKAAEPKDAGHAYLKEIDKRLKVNYRNPITFLPGLDADLGGGLSGGELGVVMAPPGGGKSMCLVKFAAEALKAGKKVVYYTLELSEKNVGQRFDACLAHRPLREIYGFSDEIKEIAQEIADKGGDLYIKEFPTGYATINTLKAHLTSLQRMFNFVPDIIFIDYADIMRPLVHYGEKRHTLTALYESIRGLAVEFNLPIWTATQTNRMAIDQEELNMSHIGEALGKAATADVILGLARGKEMKTDNKAKFWVIKNRNGSDGYYKDAHFDTSMVDIRIIGAGPSLDSYSVSHKIPGIGGSIVGDSFNVEYQDDNGDDIFEHLSS